VGNTQSRSCAILGSGDKIVSAGYNVSNDSSCPFNQATDQKSAVVEFTELAAQGGTPSLIPLRDSLLRNAIPSGTSGCGTEVATDQRDVSRPQGNGCEIGAHEILVSP
jgi:hypothetical protein